MKAMKRHHASKGHKAMKHFNQSAAKTKAANLAQNPMRGGFRF